MVGSRRMLTRAEIKGFKCLHDVSVELGPFNVLIGPNDSGKSSFLQALAEPQRLQGPSRMVPTRRTRPSATSGNTIRNSVFSRPA